ncbi:MAG: SGNH/GDSL hydrolase family protein [Magnetococcales bacterium]|nr:SGNH/GDSL hydrolase family protein [Magnetococcales bacterium]
MTVPVDGDRPGRRLARIGLIVVANLALLLVGLVILELGFGSWFSDDHLDALNILRGREILFEASKLYPGGGKVHYVRDRYGLRGGVDDPRRVDLLTLGGSTTDQRYLPLEATFQAVLERAAAADGRPLVVTNAGMDGHSTIGHLAALELWLPRIPGLAPRAVLALIGINDINADSRVRSAFDRSLEGSAWRDRVRLHSGLWRLGRNLHGLWQARLGGMDLGHGQPMEAAVAWVELADAEGADAFAARHRAHLEAYRERVGRLVDGVRAMGAEAILVTQKTADFRLGDGRLLGRRLADGRLTAGNQAWIRAIAAATMAVCHEKGAICVDMALELDLHDGDYYDLLHTTPAGSRKIGEYLYARIKDRIFP